MNFNVGQVFYVVFNNKTDVYPFRIIERTTTQKLSGEEIIYKCECPKFEKQVFSIDEVINKGGKPYFSVEDVRKHLIAKVTNAVEQIIVNAAEMANKHFGEYEQLNNEVNTLESHELTEIEPEQTSTKVLLPDGTYARLKQ